ncbi:hypothetical protein M422DRAFT_45390 [Sphaerobolus stellatus SS14]|nr:hypothetical protein M422DRAFT_45390 [Sphaerobolus stellatus SS14]
MSFPLKQASNIAYSSETGAQLLAGSVAYMIFIAVQPTPSRRLSGVFRLVKLYGTIEMALKTLEASRYFPISFIVIRRVLSTVHVWTLAINTYYHLIACRLPINYSHLDAAGRGLLLLLLSVVWYGPPISCWLRIHIDCDCSKPRKSTAGCGHNEFYYFTLSQLLRLARLDVVFANPISIHVIGIFITVVKIGILDDLNAMGDTFVIIFQGLSCAGSTITDCTISASLVYSLKHTGCHPQIDHVFHQYWGNYNFDVYLTCTNVKSRESLYYTPSTSSEANIRVSAA